MQCSERPKRISAGENYDGAVQFSTFFCISALLRPLFSPVIAWAADRVHPRKALYLFGLFLLAGATALLFFAQTVPLLIASRIMQGASASIVWVMGMTMCCETVGPEDLGKAIASVSISNRH